jgi:hypothetical protein
MHSFFKLFEVDRFISWLVYKFIMRPEVSWKWKVESKKTNRTRLASCLSRFPEKQESPIPSFFVDPRIFTKIIDFLKFGMRDTKNSKIDPPAGGFIFRHTFHVLTPSTQPSAEFIPPQRDSVFVLSPLDSLRALLFTFHGISFHVLTPSLLRLPYFVFDFAQTSFFFSLFTEYLFTFFLPKSLPLHRLWN